MKLAVLAARPEFPVVPGLFAVRFGTNTGVAFGLFQGFPLAVTFVGGGILVALPAYLGRIAPVATTLERAYHWPTFNLADSAITIDASMLALGLIRGQRAGATTARGNG